MIATHSAILLARGRFDFGSIPLSFLNESRLSILRFCLSSATSLSVKTRTSRSVFFALFIRGLLETDSCFSFLVEGFSLVLDGEEVAANNVLAASFKRL